MLKVSIFEIHSWYQQNILRASFELPRQLIVMKTLEQWSKQQYQVLIALYDKSLFWIHYVYSVMIITWFTHNQVTILYLHRPLMLYVNNRKGVKVMNIRHQHMCQNKLRRKAAIKKNKICLDNSWIKDNTTLLYW